MTRPYPPAELLNDPLPRFIPAPEVEKWAREQFIAETAALANEDHFHLNAANIGFLWTNAENSRNGRTIDGQCELMPPMAMGKWQKARALNQIEEWFGLVPHFIITISAAAAFMRDDASFMALVEHELYHAAQAKDEFGQPKFNKETGLPTFAIRGHDIEEFVPIIERYGADVAPGMREAVRAANKGPSVAAAAIARSCGTCLRLVK